MCVQSYVYLVRKVVKGAYWFFVFARVVIYSNSFGALCIDEVYACGSISC